MSLFKLLEPLQASKNGSINLCLTAKGNGEWSLAVSPVVGVVDEKSPSAIKLLKAALSREIVVVGTEAEVLDDLAKHVSEQAPDRALWREQVDAINAAVASAAAEKTPVSKKTSVSTASKSLCTEEPDISEHKAEPDNDLFSL